MIERALVDQILEDTSLEREDAEAAVERVFAAVLALLRAGRTVRIPEVGKLTAPKKPVWLPGSNKRQAVLQRKVSIRNAGIVERGEPYDVKVLS